MREQDSKDRDWALVALAERQEGLLRHEQLLALGLDKSAIHRRLDGGRLHRRHRGVYTLGHRLLRPRGEWLAAAWAIDGGVLSHLSAAAFHGWMDAPAVQHVTTTGKATSRPGLQVHRVASLDERDVVRHPLVAATRHARTIIDLAAILPRPEFRAVVDRIRRLDVQALRAAWARAPRARGAKNLRRLLGRLEAHTRSEFERRFLRFCRRHGVPLPDAVNSPVAGALVDCRYEAARVLVELDGRAFHARQDQMRADRRRDRRALRGRYVTVRLVWEDLDDDAAAATVEDLLDILAV
jgi:predicted transcriptional regulator of viral defense system